MRGGGGGDGGVVRNPLITYQCAHGKSSVFDAYCSGGMAVRMRKVLSSCVCILAPRA